MLRKKKVNVEEHNRVREALEEEVRRLHKIIDELKEERRMLLGSAISQAKKNQDLAKALEKSVKRSS